ncbi:MAG: STAS/SEC14 domain-containing protein [Sphingobacteriaceae bacterium]|nr:STAS/SEC14 domain-containing protein [Sphingobacteriaceae bacterium]
MKRETSNSILEYADHILYVRIKEGAELTIESMKEQYEAQYELVKNDKYSVLIDGKNNVIVPIEARAFMAEHNPPNRKATAIVSNKNLATLILANFYIKVNKPKVSTKLFQDELKAKHWLKQKLQKALK